MRYIFMFPYQWNASRFSLQCSFQVMFYRSLSIYIIWLASHNIDMFSYHQAPWVTLYWAGQLSIEPCHINTHGHAQFPGGVLKMAAWPGWASLAEGFSQIKFAICVLRPNLSAQHYLSFCLGAFGFSWASKTILPAWVPTAGFCASSALRAISPGCALG